MVTIIDCVKRTSKMGEEFIALIVQDELELVTSKSGNIYATSHRASVPCTLEIEVAKLMIGKELPGSIEKRECLTYETVNSDGELITLNYRWEYVPEEQVTPVKQIETVPFEGFTEVRV